MLMGPLHLARDHDPTHVLTQLPASVVRDLTCGRVHVSAIDVLCKEFGDQHNLEGSALRQVVISVLEQLNLLTGDRDAEDVYLRMYLMHRYDFVQNRKFFVCSKRIEVSYHSPLESSWYALVIVFEAGSIIEGRGGVMMAAGIPPDQQSAWWTSVNLTSRSDQPPHCLTDGKLCEVSPARTREGTKSFELCCGTPPTVGLL